MVIERKRIPKMIYMVVRDMGTPRQRTQLYHNFYYAEERRQAVNGKMFAISTHAMEEIA